MIMCIQYLKKEKNIIYLNVIQIYWFQITDMMFTLNIFIENISWIAANVIKKYYQKEKKYENIYDKTRKSRLSLWR